MLWIAFLGSKTAICIILRAKALQRNYFMDGRRILNGTIALRSRGTMSRYISYFVMREELKTDYIKL